MKSKIYHRIKSMNFENFELTIVYNHIEKNIEKCLMLLKMSQKLTKNRNSKKSKSTVESKID